MPDIYSQLEGILANTYAPDGALRNKAELDLKAYLALPNSFNGFLGICEQAHISPSIKLAAVLTIKNNARNYWRAVEPLYTMSDDEKTSAKDVLMQLLMKETNNPLRALLAEVMKAVVEHEFPERWPTLVPTLVTNLQSSDRLTVYNSLIALRKLVKFFEYRDDREGLRKPLFDIMIAVFPTLQGLVSAIMQQNQIEVAMVFHQVMKIFWSCTMYRLPAPETSQACDVNFWFQFMSFVLEKPLPAPGAAGEPAGQPADEEGRKSWPWWRAKKWASRNMTHFIARYGNPKAAASENEQFAIYFRNNTAPTLLGPVMNCLATQARGEFITEVVHRQCLGFMQSAMEMSPTYKLIKGHMDFVLFQMILPTLALSESDVEVFNTDPVEFVRKVNSPMEDWLDPRVAAGNLLEVATRLRGKDVIPRLLEWMEQQLMAFNAEADLAKRDYKLKDAIIVAFATVFRVRIRILIAIMVPFCLYHCFCRFCCSYLLVGR